MATIRNDVDLAWAAATVPERLGRVILRALLVTAQIQYWTCYAGGQLQDVWHARAPIEETLGGEHIPPARHQHQVLAPSGSHHRMGLCRDFFQPVSRHQA